MGCFRFGLTLIRVNTVGIEQAKQSDYLKSSTQERKEVCGMIRTLAVDWASISDYCQDGRKNAAENA
jgi:hypothetical protein